jgi:AcrR family transcriptional regulator
MAPQRTQAMRSQTARDQIVHAALTVFALKGYAAASMDDVRMAAGCSKGGLYHHFAGKPAVLSAVVDRLIATNQLMPTAAGGPAEGGLSPAALGRVLLEVWAEATRDDELRARLNAGYEQQVALPLAGSPMTALLTMGALIQSLTQGGTEDPGQAARRLGIERAA